MTKKTLPAKKRFMYACLFCNHRKIVDTAEAMFDARSEHQSDPNHRHLDPHFVYLETDETGRFVKWQAQS